MAYETKNIQAPIYTNGIAQYRIGDYDNLSSNTEGIPASNSFDTPFKLSSSDADKASLSGTECGETKTVRMPYKLIPYIVAFNAMK